MSEFVEYLQEVFRLFGPVQLRKMFSGYGLYYDGAMFGLVAEDLLYLKADSTIAHYFEARGLEQFSYTRADKLIKMSYYLAPEEIYEDQAEAAMWARRSFEVAFRTKKSKPDKRIKQPKKQLKK